MADWGSDSIPLRVFSLQLGPADPHESLSASFYVSSPLSAYASRSLSPCARAAFLMASILSSSWCSPAYPDSLLGSEKFSSSRFFRITSDMESHPLATSDNIRVKELRRTYIPLSTRIVTDFSSACRVRLHNSLYLQLPCLLHVYVIMMPMFQRLSVFS